MNPYIISLLLSLLYLYPEISIAQYNYSNNPLANTYSIVALDTATGEMGVAVESHWFSVGTVVSWGEAGVGVVATQSFANPKYGPHGLALLKLGYSPEQVLDFLTSADEGRAYRQAAILNNEGKVAAHTGDKCIEAAGHQIGEYYSVQANMMDTNTVWPAMARAFEASAEKPLAERLLLTLEAAEAEGGDIRGKQSAAILVVAAELTGNPLSDRVVDLHVADHPEPLKELRRLLNVHKAYQHMNKGDAAVEHGDAEMANREYGAAEKLFPENKEMKYWHAVALANMGELDQALPLFKEVFKNGENWLKLTPRLIDNGVLQVDEDTLQRILKL